MTELLPLATYSLVMSSTPGPNNLLLTTSGANFGYRRTLPHILGIGAGHGVQVWLTCLGLGALFARYPLLHTGLQAAGAAYLVWLAWKLTGSAIGRAELPQPVGFWPAAGFQFVNPKNWVKSVTVASVFLPPGLGTGTAALVAMAITVTINFPCVSMWALFGVVIRRVLTDPRRQRIFNVIMAATLVALALLLLVR